MRRSRTVSIPADWRCCPVGARPILFSLREQAALAWTEAVTALGTGHIDDTLYADAAAQFPGRALADLTLVIIAINAWNRVAVPFRKTVVLAPKMDIAA